MVYHVIEIDMADEEREPFLPKESSSEVRTSEQGQANGGLKFRLINRLKKSYNVKALFSVKPIEVFKAEREARPEGSSLAERLELTDLLGYGVGCTVGAGIYSLIGIGAGIAGNS